MDKEDKTKSEEEIKKQTLNIYLLIIGVIVAGVSFAWHILSLLFKN